jgi:hypothetical protein
MKITDILIEYDRPADISDEPLKNYMKLLNGDIRHIGSGYYAVVFEKPENPENTVTKTGKGTVRRDAYGEFTDAYVDFVMNLQKNPRAQDNPFFPQVYEIKFYPDEEEKGSFRYSMELEKLKPFKSYDYYETTVLKKALEHLENEPMSQFTQFVGMLKRIAKFDTEELFRETLESYGGIEFEYVLTHFLQNFVELRVYPPKTPQAADAVKIIHQSGGNFDLHARNVMYRRTPYGPQLVFTDPLS